MSGFSFACSGYELKSDGCVAYYIIEVSFSSNRSTEVMKLTPAQLSSYKAFKVAMINRRIPYLPSRKEHNELLPRLFLTIIDAI